MFGFAPKAPVNAEARSWVQHSMHWFLEIFGEEQFRKIQTILPTRDFFPEEWDGTDVCAASVLSHVCSYMNVDPARLHLQVFEDASEEAASALKELLPHWRGGHAGAAGFYQEPGEAEKITISIKRSKLRDPIALIATIAHELGHVLLLGDGKLERDAEHLEPLTDLVTVFWGMGIFTANSAVSFRQFDDGHKHGWSIQRQGYLSEEMFGYALAFFATMRQESRPQWIRHLNTNVGSYCKQSLRFIRHESARRK